MVDWPVILKHANDPELDYFDDLKTLENSIEQFGNGSFEEDYLIDSGGRVYALDTDDAGKVVLKDMDRCQSLEQVLGLVKAHAAQAASCCVAKLWAPTIREALEIVPSVSSDNL
jgi:hypothetical protein